MGRIPPTSDTPNAALQASINKQRSEEAAGEKEAKQGAPPNDQPSPPPAYQANYPGTSDGLACPPR